MLQPFSKGAQLAPSFERGQGALSIGEIAGLVVRQKAMRTFQRVRRNSYHSTDPRAAALWQPLGSKPEALRLIGAHLKAAEDYDRRHKQPGKRNGPLGHVALEVLKELYRFVDFKTGRCDPAILTICEKLRRSKDAVCKAMKRLKEHGFLDWVRRTEPVDSPGAGPQVKQISNAYGFGLPKCAVELVKKIMGKAPPPDCELARREDDSAEVKAMLDRGSIDQQVGFVCDDPDLAEQLKRLGNAIAQKERESVERSESYPESYI